MTLDTSSHPPSPDSPSGAVPASPAATGSPRPVAVSRRLAARLSGIGYVLLFALAIFANFMVREGLIVAGDSEATAANVVESEGLFRLGLISFIIVFILDVVISWALHLLFRSADHDLSLLTAWFRIVYTVFLGVAVVFFFEGLQLLSGEAYLDVFDRRQLNAQALVAFENFNATWLIGLVGFGIHLVLLGTLVIRSGYGPRLLGYLLMLAGVAYVVDTAANALLGNYEDYATLFTTMVAVPSIVAEGWFGLWLLFRAGNDSRSPSPGRPYRPAGELALLS